MKKFHYELPDRPLEGGAESFRTHLNSRDTGDIQSAILELCPFLADISGYAAQYAATHLARNWSSYVLDSVEEGAQVTPAAALKNCLRDVDEVIEALLWWRLKLEQAIGVNQ